MTTNPSRFRRFLQFLRRVPRPRTPEVPPKREGVWDVRFRTSIVKNLDPSITTEPKIEVVIQIPLLGGTLTFKRRATQTDPRLVEAVIEDLRIHLADTLAFTLGRSACVVLRERLRIQLTHDETVPIGHWAQTYE